MKTSCRYVLAILLLWAFTGCSARPAPQATRIFKEPGLGKPGMHDLAFRLDGRDTLADYLSHEKERNPCLSGFDVPALMRIFRNAFPQLYLPVQPGAPLCNLETNFSHCKGIELRVDFEIYRDDTVVLHSRVWYHVKLRLEGGQPNFFRAAKAQRDRGEFALPRHYYVGSLVETVQKALPILQEIATDYHKYLKNGDEEIAIELILEESRAEALARQSENGMKDAAETGGGVMISVLPNISFLTGLTIAALRSGGKTFWQVLQEEKQFELYKEKLAVDQVEFSYSQSIADNLPRILLRSSESASDIVVREIVIRLIEKERNEIPLDAVSGPPGPGPGLKRDAVSEPDAEGQVALRKMSGCRRPAGLPRSSMH